MTPCTGGQSTRFRQAWDAFCENSMSKFGQYITADITNQVMAHDLAVAESILADATGPRINQPIGFLKWKLREIQKAAAERPAVQQSPGNRAGGGAPAVPSVGASPRLTAPAVRSANAQPSDPLMPQFPLQAVDAGGATNMHPERMHCMGCALPLAVRRRVTRPGGTDQPQALHRFGRCGCGASLSVVMHEHFQNMYMVDYMVIRPENTNLAARPSLVPTATLEQAAAADGSTSAQPSIPVPRFAVEELRCPGCTERLGLSVYDPIDHLKHYIEYTCYYCREVYCGTVMASGQRILGTLMRSAQPAADAA
jgi:hypothetical protein